MEWGSVADDLGGGVLGVGWSGFGMDPGEAVDR